MSPVNSVTRISSYVICRRRLTGEDYRIRPPPKVHLSVSIPCKMARVRVRVAVRFGSLSAKVHSQGLGLATADLGYNGPWRTRISDQNPRTDADSKFYDPRVSISDYGTRIPRSLSSRVQRANANLCGL